jgi:hypothetical protein
MNLYVKRIPSIKKKNKDIVKFYLTLELLGLTYKVMGCLTEMDSL